MEGGKERGRECGESRKMQRAEKRRVREGSPGQGKKVVGPGEQPFHRQEVWSLITAPPTGMAPHSEQNFSTCLSSFRPHNSWLSRDWNPPPGWGQGCAPPGGAVGAGGAAKLHWNLRTGCEMGPMLWGAERGLETPPRAGPEFLQGLKLPQLGSGAPDGQGWPGLGVPATRASLRLFLGGVRRPLSCPLSPGIAFGGRKVGAVPKVVPAPWGQPAPNGWPVGRECAKARSPCFNSLLKGGPSARAPERLERLRDGRRPLVWLPGTWLSPFAQCRFPLFLLFLQVLTNKPPSCKSHSLRAFPGNLTYDTDSNHWAPGGLQLSSPPSLFSS